MDIVLERHVVQSEYNEIHGLRSLSGALYVRRNQYYIVTEHALSAYHVILTHANALRGAEATLNAVQVVLVRLSAVPRGRRTVVL